MATLIAQTTGDRTRRCDSRCYLAKGPNCYCVCRGMNHGKGLDQAVALTRAMEHEEPHVPERTFFPIPSPLPSSPRKRTQVKDLATNITYPSKYAAGKALAHLVRGSYEDHYVYFKIVKAFPGRFEEVV